MELAEKMLAGQYEASLAKSGKQALEYLDRVRVVGINTPVWLYELWDLQNDMNIEEKADVFIWEKTIDLFERGFFEMAEEAFSFFGKEKTGGLYGKNLCGSVYELNPECP